MKLFSVLLILIIFSTVSSATERPDKNRMHNYIAVFDIDTEGVDRSISRPLTDSIRKEIVKSGKYDVIDRTNMNKILGEQKFQLSGCVSGTCVVEAGQLLGVGKIITGSASMVGKIYYMTLQIVNVETGKIEDISEDKCKCEIDDLIGSSKQLVKRLLGEKGADLELLKPAKSDIEILNKVVGHWLSSSHEFYDKTGPKPMTYRIEKEYFDLDIKIVNNNINISTNNKSTTIENIRLENNKLLFMLVYSGSYPHKDSYEISIFQQNDGKLEATYVRDKINLNNRNLTNVEYKIWFDKLDES